MKNKIHPAYNITEVAVRYYKIVHPERDYERQHALRQLSQDKKINEKILLKILKEIFNEQKAML